MDAQTDILKRGLEHAALAVMDASALANLHLGPKRIGPAGSAFLRQSSVG